MKKLGILGGTFDPVHNAHLALAHAALEQFSLDSVLFIPTGQPVRKLGRTFASAEDRLQMLKEACFENPKFRVSSLEVDRPEVTYTIDTLRELKLLIGEDVHLCLIVGEDTALDLSSWKESAEIAKLVTVLFARRPWQDKTQELPEGFTCHEIKMPEHDLSSSEVRSLLLQGDDVSALVPARVLAYIRKHGLYAQPERNI